MLMWKAVGSIRSQISSQSPSSSCDDGDCRNQGANGAQGVCFEGCKERGAGRVCCPSWR